MDHETGVGVGADKENCTQGSRKDRSNLSLHHVVSNSFFHLNPSRDIFADQLHIFIIYIFFIKGRHRARNNIIFSEMSIILLSSTEYTANPETFVSS